MCIEIDSSDNYVHFISITRCPTVPNMATLCISGKLEWKNSICTCLPYCCNGAHQRSKQPSGTIFI